MNVTFPLFCAYPCGFLSQSHHILDLYIIIVVAPTTFLFFIIIIFFPFVRVDTHLFFGCYFLVLFPFIAFTYFLLASFVAGDNAVAVQGCNPFSV